MSVATISSNTPSVHAIRRRKRAAASVQLVGANKNYPVRVTNPLMWRILAVIESSGLVEWLNDRLPEADPARRAYDSRQVGGRHRTLRVDAVLASFIALGVTEQALIVRDAAKLLNGLHPTMKHALGVPRVGEMDERGRVCPDGVTERMVSRLWNQMAAIMDPSPHSENNRKPYEQAKEAIRQVARDQLIEEHPDVDLDFDDATVRDLVSGMVTDELDALRAEFKEKLALQREWLDHFVTEAIRATLPADYAPTSFAIDATAVRSWARQNRKQPKKVWLHPDPDAAWNGKKVKGNERGDGWFGYWATGVTGVPEAGDQDSDMPCLLTAINVIPANADTITDGLHTLTRMCAANNLEDDASGRDRRARNDVLADKGYTAAMNPATDRWFAGLFELGFQSVHDLKENQRGHTDTLASGAVVVDGGVYSPTLPEDLRNIEPPQIGATRAEIRTYQDEIAKRKPYSLATYGRGRNDDGSLDIGCRAASTFKALRCANQPTSLVLPLSKLTVYPPANTAGNAICAQAKVRIGFDELVHWQKLPYGSAEWYASYNRRNRVEGIFGNMKNDAAQDLTRGQFRVMGIAKTTLMVTFAAIATNMRLLDAHKQRLTAKQAAADATQNQPPAGPRRRTKRYRTRMRAEMSAHIKREQSRLVANRRALIVDENGTLLGVDENGEVVDLTPFDQPNGDPPARE